MTTAPYTLHRGRISTTSVDATRPSEAETFWSTFLKGLVRRGLKGVRLVISDAHEGLKHALAKVLGATWQRCRVHWLRGALAHVPIERRALDPSRVPSMFDSLEVQVLYPV
jgi:transposase-like protein